MLNLFRGGVNKLELLKMLNSHAGVGLWDAQLYKGDPMHPKSRWTWSPEFRRLLGFAPDDTKEFANTVHSWADRLHPDDVAAIFEKFTACLNDASGKTRYDVVYRLKTKGGQYKWFHGVGGAVHTLSGTARRACGALIDIDQEKDKEEQSELLGRFSGVGLWDAVLANGDAMDPESAWSWTPEVRRLLGFDADDFEGFPDKVHSWSDRLHPDDAAATFEKFGACLNDRSGQTGFDVNYRLKTKSGEYKWFRAFGGVARDSAGRPLRACGSLVDIQERKIMEDLRIRETNDLADSLDTSVGEMASHATETSRSVASAAEELSVSAAEMDKRVGESAQEIAKAFEEAMQASDIVQSLGNAADEIGNVVDLIKSIASQTDLLALNATIEAARAGEVGKGFAVVATEVKELAQQTSMATEDIVKQVSTLQNQSQQALDAIGVIEKTMQAIKEASDELARPIGEQRMATQEIAEQIARIVEEIDKVSDTINAATQEMRQ